MFGIRSQIMNEVHIAVFRAVMLTGTITGAAEVLGRSQPSVSRLLHNFETELGVKLFDRRKGLILPTRTAVLILDEVERAHASFEMLRTSALNLSRGKNSEIHIAAMPALGLSFVPSVMPKFQELSPNTKVAVDIRMSVQVEDWAASQQIDFGLAETPFKRSGFSTEIFSSVPYVAAVPKDHELAGRSTLYPEDLERGPLISWTSSATGHFLLNQALQAYEVSPVSAYATNISESAYEMVKNGLGIAIIDPFTAIQRWDDRALILPFTPAIPFNVALLQPISKSGNPAVQLLLDVLRNERDKILKQVPAAPIEA